jgi:hypothetical protein
MAFTYRTQKAMSLLVSIGKLLIRLINGVVAFMMEKAIQNRTATILKWMKPKKPHNKREFLIMEQLVRYSPPTRYDLAPRCTICKVMGDEQVYKLYVQTSEASDASCWVPMGELLERTFDSFTQDHEFINACVDVCTNKEGSHMQIIVEKIKPK